MTPETTTGRPSGSTEVPAHFELKPPADPNPPWGAKYAQWYDLIHSDHDYHGAVLSYKHIIRDRFGTKPVRVLEFGCGTGVFSYYFTYNMPGGSTVVGYDDSQDMLEQAHQNYDRPRQAFTDTLPDGPFDIIVGHFNVVNYIPHFQEWAQMMDSRLEENGLLMFDCLNAEDVLRRGAEHWTRWQGRQRFSAYVVCSPSRSGGLLTLKYTVQILKDRKFLDEFTVTHHVTLHLLSEITGALVLAGRKYLSIEPMGQGRLYVSRRVP